MKARKPGLWIGVGGFVLLAAVVCWLAFEREGAAPPLPNPNGYDYFVRAAAKIVRPPDDPADFSPQQWDAWLEGNRDALAEFRKGLAHECRVPARYSWDWLNAKSLANLKALALAVKAESQLIARKSDTNRAVQVAMELVKLGHGIGRGVMIDSLVGSVCELMGIQQLTNLVNALHQAEIRSLLAELEQIEAKREPKASILLQERRWIRANFSVVEYIKAILESRSLQPSKDSMDRYSAGYDERVLKTRRALLNFAVRAFDLEHGRQPKTVHELVPEYLKALPISPTTGEPLDLFFSPDQTNTGVLLP